MQDCRRVECPRETPAIAPAAGVLNVRAKALAYQLRMRAAPNSMCGCGRAECPREVPAETPAARSVVVHHLFNVVYVFVTTFPQLSETFFFLTIRPPPFTPAPIRPNCRTH